jgi:hypothetical protein
MNLKSRISNFCVILALCLCASVVNARAQTTVTIASPLSITSSPTLSQATALSSYAVAFSMSGCATPWNWSFAPGSTAPGGLALSTAGKLSGTLSNGGVYSFSIAAKCGGIFSITTAPLILIGAHVVSLTWTAANGAAGYNIYRGTAPGKELATALNASPLTGSAFTDSGVSPGGTYYYVLKSVSSTGTLSGASSEARATVASP